MRFLGIDQHARQLTVSLRDQDGNVILARQVSTPLEKILDFFDQLTRCCAEPAAVGRRTGRSPEAHQGQH